jgi:hypothetical protein
MILNLTVRPSEIPIASRPVTVVTYHAKLRAVSAHLSLSLSALLQFLFLRRVAYPRCIFAISPHLTLKQDLVGRPLKEVFAPAFDRVLLHPAIGRYRPITGWLSSADATQALPAWGILPQNVGAPLSQCCLFSILHHAALQAEACKPPWEFHTHREDRHALEPALVRAFGPPPGG